MVKMTFSFCIIAMDYIGVKIEKLIILYCSKNGFIILVQISPLKESLKQEDGDGWHKMAALF